MNLISKELNELIKLANSIVPNSNYQQLEFKHLEINDIYQILYEFQKSNFTTITVQNQLRIRYILSVYLYNPLEDSLENEIYSLLENPNFSSYIYQKLKDSKNTSIVLLLRKFFFYFIEKMLTNQKTKKGISSFISSIIQKTDFFYLSGLKDFSIYTNDLTKTEVLNIYKEYANICFSKLQKAEDFWIKKYGIIDNKSNQFHIQKIETFIWNLFLKKARLDSIKEVDSLFFLKYLIPFYKKSSCAKVEEIIYQLDNYKSIKKPFVEYLIQNIGNPPDWEKLPGVTEDIKNIYDGLINSIKFNYFEMIAHIIFDSETQFYEKRRLNSRYVFWTNYEKKIFDIKIFLPYHQLETVKLNRNKLQGGHIISDQFLKEIEGYAGDSPICFLFFPKFTVMETFQGSQNNTQILNITKREWNSFIQTDKKETLIYSSDHRNNWMSRLAYYLEERLGISPESKEEFKIPLYIVDEEIIFKQTKNINWEKLIANKNL